MKKINNNLPPIVGSFGGASYIENYIPSIASYSDVSSSPPSTSDRSSPASTISSPSSSSVCSKKKKKRVFSAETSLFWNILLGNRSYLQNCMNAQKTICIPPDEEVDYVLNNLKYSASKMQAFISRFYVIDLIFIVIFLVEILPVVIVRIRGSHPIQFTTLCW